MNFYKALLLSSFMLISNAWCEEENTFSNSAESRLQYMEDQLRSLTGKVEELEHALKTQNLNNSNLPHHEGPSSSVHGAASQESTSHKGDMTISNSTHDTSAGTSTNADAGASAGTPSSASGSGLPDDEAQADYDRAISLLNQGAFSEAEVSLLTFIKTYPDHSLIMNAKYWLGETYYARKDYARACVSFGDVYKLYKQASQKDGAGKNPGKAPEALVKLVFSLKGLGKDDAARATLAQLRKEFPHLSKSVERLAQQAQKKLGMSEDTPKKDSSPKTKEPSSKKTTQALDKNKSQE